MTTDEELSALKTYLKAAKTYKPLQRDECIDQFGLELSELFGRCITTTLPSDSIYRHPNHLIEQLLIRSNGYPLSSFTNVNIPAEKALYRLLFLAEPENVSFKDFWRGGGFFSLWSADYAVLANVSITHADLKVDLYVPEFKIAFNERTRVTSYVPVGNPTFKPFRRALVGAIKHPWLMDYGNDRII